jgi:hypothetical protein
MSASHRFSADLASSPPLVGNLDDGAMAIPMSSFVITRIVRGGEWLGFHGRIGCYTVTGGFE